jgi:hypothetical protein
MNTTVTPTLYNTTVANILTVVTVLFIAAVLAGIKLPLISGYRAALIGLLVIGMALCMQGGIGKVAAVNDWAHPLSILGYLLGALILVVVAAGLFGKSLPLVSGERSAFIAAATLMAAKFLFTSVHQFLLK